MEENQNQPLVEPQTNSQPEIKESAPANVLSVVKKNKILSTVIFTVFGFFPIVLAAMLFLKYPNKQSVIRLDYSFSSTTTTSTILEKSTQKTYLLKKDEEFLIPNTTISATLRESVPADSGCHDCTSLAKIDIKNNDQAIKKLEFSCGGFSGDCIEELEVFGTKIILIRQIDNKNVEIKIRNN